MITTTIASVFKYILARVLEWHTQNKCTGKDKDVLTKTKIKKLKHGGKIMVVQHNLTAMNSNRMLGITTGTQAKSTEKLSSGYKINRAADDAAGLSISEKMRRQIRGLTQASLNAEDGISAVQTAEGALNEVQDMLQRMNELAVKASNGTMSENDRSYVQNEIDQLVTEIDRVAETTKFNETYLLKGDGAGKSGAAATSVNVGAGAAANLTLAANHVVNAGDYAVGTVQVSSTVTGNATATIDQGTFASSDLGKLLNESTTGTITLTAGEDATDGDDLSNITWSVSSGTSTQTFTHDQLIAAGLTLAANGTQVNEDDTVVVSKELTQSTSQKAALAEQGLTYDTANPARAAGLKDVALGSDLMATIKVDANGVGTVSAYDKDARVGALDLSLHVGADSTQNNKIGIKIESMSAKNLGLTTATGAAIRVDGKDSTNADKAIDTIANAIQKVSTQRSALGAVQNRLEHTIANLDNVVENTTAAESQIRDTDMATEMVKYSNNNILAQAGQAMLAQANQANQGVLSLLG